MTLFISVIVHSKLVKLKKIRNTTMKVLVCLVVYLFVSRIDGVKPYFPVTENSEVIVNDGSHIGLKCVPEGDPKPTITWHLPNNINEQSELFIQHIRYHFNEVELEIINFNKDLLGTYVCLAHNSDGTASFTYNVRYTPETTTPSTSTVPFTIQPEVFLKYTVQNVTEGDPVLAIPCAADGLPKPTITWSLIGQNMPSNAVQFEQFLIIRDIRLDNSRYYLCNATNSVGSAFKAVHIIVIPKPHVLPNVTLPPSLQGKYGETITLNCGVTGYPSPIIKWYFNGNLLPSHTSQHTINNPTLVDIGAYTCEATNDVGTSKADVVYLVQGTPPTLTTAPPQSVTANPNNHPKLTCIATGDPKPDINWTFKPFIGTATNVNLEVSPDHTTLSLPNIQQSGLVTCTAINPFGQVQATSSVIYIATLFG